jgi:hypothetical protein
MYVWNQTYQLMSETVMIIIGVSALPCLYRCFCLSVHQFIRPADMSVCLQLRSDIS